ncbi:trehalose-phosphatase [Desulfolutivibrio sulfoxidireducens]|uniref:trehalose-phosphatase n=1 Tax=Desulfolutivibrio sulfoxidireducens TaxID=2773299 RepID=UPI00159E4921|nr:trehalose-phosphatase [Desulfolutivibrio sulfoxidireducens]QLA15452.1 trehalose-phosphatase [Desulfolutivibrio sulfoxidireducens]
MNDPAGIAALFADPFLDAILAGRREGILLLDYDGTLAPFRDRRDQAVPYPGVVETLGRLPAHGPGRFAVVSGRMGAEVADFLHPARPSEIWGCHGAERLSPGGAPRIQAMPWQWEEALRRAFDLAAEAAPAGALEWKTVSLALHWRGMDTAEQQRLARHVGSLWAELARQTGLVPHAFDGGLELRPPGWDKGLAVRAMRRENPGAALVYLGDDLTDEDAFQALGPSDIGVLVRERPRLTLARYRITPPGELLGFLRVWADSMRGAPHEPRR